MKVKLIGTLICLLLLGNMLTACAHLSDQKKREGLEMSKKFFWKSLRWKSYDTAASKIKHRDLSKTLRVDPGLGNITVTAYEEIASSNIGESGDVLSIVLFDYIQDETGRVLQIKHSELWWYEKESGQWYLDSGFPKFKMGR